MRGRRSGSRVQVDDEAQASTPAGWPTGGDVLAVVDPHAIAQQLLEKVSNDDMLALLKRVGPEVSRVVLHVINLNLSGKVNAGMAGQLLVRLRHDKVTASSHALRALLFPVVEVFRRLELDADEWRTLVESADQRIDYEFDEYLFRAVQQVPASLRPVGFAVAIAHRSSAAAAALGFLARQRPDLAERYAALRAAYPALPSTYGVDVADVVDPARGAATAGESPGHDAGPFDPAAELERVERDWALARSAAERAGSALTAGTLPAEEDLVAIVDLGPQVQRSARRFAAQVGGDVAPDLDALRAAATTIERTRSRSWLRRLSGLSVPEQLGDVLDDVRAAVSRAATAPEDDAELRNLRSLYDFLVAAAVSAEHAREHADRLALDETLPAPLSTLVFKELIKPGLLVLPAGAGEAETSVGHPAPAEPADDDRDAGGAPDAEPVEPVATAPADATAPAGPQGPPPASEDPMDTLDAELGELLDERFDRLLTPPAPPDTTVAPGPAALPDPSGKAVEQHAHQVAARSAAAPPPQSQPPAPAMPAASTPAGDGERHRDAPPAAMTTITEAQATLIEASRFGLAARIAEATGRPPAVVAARQAMAYAANLRGSAGSLAAAFAAGAEHLTRASLADDRAGQLLGWGATISVAASVHLPQLAPVLEDLQPAIDDYAGLTALGRALSDATRSGIVVAQETGATMAATLDLEQVAQRHADRAAHLIDIARSRSIKYAPANAVYLAWMSERGMLGTLLRLVLRNDVTRLAEVRGQILHAQGQEDRRIDDQYARQRGRRNSRIEAGARQKLRAQYRDALQVASDWVSTVERLRQLQEQHADPSAERVDRIRREILRCRDDVRRDIERLRTEERARGRIEVIAAAGAVGDLIQRIFDGFGGQAAELTGPEPSADYVANGELAATDLLLDPHRLRFEPRLGEAHLDQLVRVASGPPMALDELYTHRARLGDHDVTQRLIDEARVVDPPLAGELAERRAADEAECGAHLRPALEAIKLKVEQDRMAGVLDERQWSFYALDVERLEAHGRRDYRRIAEEIATLDHVLVETRAAVVDQLLAEIDREAFDNEKVAAHQERLKAMARQGEIAGAEEYLEQIRAGRDLPAPDRSARHLSRFFPAVPELFATWPELLESLLDGLRRDAVDDGLDALHQATELSVRNLDERRRRAGELSVKSWLGLSARKLRAHGLDTQRALIEVLSQAGIELKSATPTHPRRRRAAGGCSPTSASSAARRTRPSAPG